MRRLRCIVVLLALATLDVAYARPNRRIDGADGEADGGFPLEGNEADDGALVLVPQGDDPLSSSNRVVIPYNGRHELLVFLA